MRVALKVIGGKNDGREIRIGVPEFIIGRGEDAHLKPTSDLISRQHCRIKLDQGKVIIEDLKSRNGTFVNGQALTGPHVVKSGDLLRVGRLQFEMLVDPVQAGNKKPKVEGVVEAASRAAQSAGAHSIEDSITDWLGEEDDGEMTPAASRSFQTSDTIQMNLEDTANFQPTSSEEEGGEEGEEEEEVARFKKQKPGKLPPLPKHSHDDSKTAADDVLRRFFNRR